MARTTLILAALLALAACGGGSGDPADPGPGDVPAVDPGPGDPGTPDTPPLDPGTPDVPADPGDPDLPGDPGAPDTAPADLPGDVPADPGAADVPPADVPPEVAVDAGPQPPGEGELGGPCDPADQCDLGQCEAIGGVKTCTMDCLDNDGCPTVLRCEAIAADRMVCLYGPRGTGDIGDPCGESKGLGCASGLCVDADPEGGIAVDTCTASCEDDDDCKDPFPTCFLGVYLCLPPVG